MKTITHCQSCGKDLEEKFRIEEERTALVTCGHLECERIAQDKMYDCPDPIEELKALRRFMRDFDAWHTETRFPEQLYNEQYHRMYTSWQEAESIRRSRAWRAFDTPGEYP